MYSANHHNAHLLPTLPQELASKHESGPVERPLWMWGWGAIPLPTELLSLLRQRNKKYRAARVEEK